MFWVCMSSKRYCLLICRVPDKFAFIYWLNGCQIPYNMQCFFSCKMLFLWPLWGQLEYLSPTCLSLLALLQTNAKALSVMCRQIGSYIHTYQNYISMDFMPYSVIEINQNVTNPFMSHVTYSCLRLDLGTFETTSPNFNYFGHFHNYYATIRNCILLVRLFYIYFHPLIG